MVRKKQKKKVSKKIIYLGRKPSGKSKKSKVAKLIRLARLRKNKKNKKKKL